MKIYIKYLLLLILFLSWGFYSQSYADMAMIFNDCKMPGQGQTNTNTNNNNQNGAISSSISADDYNYCDNVCKTRFASQEQNVNVEINQNLILECFNLCKDKLRSSNQISYLAAAKRSYPGTQSITMTDKSTNQSFSGSVDYSIYQYEIPQIQGFNTSSASSKKATDKYFSQELKNDSITTIKLDSSGTNIIYACGHKFITLDPVFPNMFQMSPDTVSGGDSEKILISVNPQDFSQTKTNVILNNENYAGVKDFNYDEYVKSFNRNPQNFDEMLKNLFCDSYIQDISKSGKAFNCTQDAVNIYKFDASICDGCSAPDTCAKVRAGTMSKEDCKKVTASQCCDIEPYTLDSSIIKKYSGITKVNVDQSYFYRNGWSMSASTVAGSTEWTNETIKYHPCLNTKTTPPSNKAVTDVTANQPNHSYSPSMTISIDNYPEKVGCYPQWHMYNTSYMDTGIVLSDGDFLSISWGGNFVFGNGLNVPFFDQSVAKSLAAGDEWIFANFSQSPVVKNLKKLSMLKIISTLEFEGLNPLIGENGESPKQDNSSNNSGQPDGIEGEICNKKTIYDLRTSKAATPWYNLNGTIHRTSGKPISSDQNAPCKDRSISGDTYGYSGNLAGIGKEYPLKIRHYFSKDVQESELYNNSIISGGYKVSIEWGGCPMANGKGLQIALGKNDSVDGDLKWTNISEASIQNGYKLAPTDSGVPTVNQFFNSSDYDTIFMRVDTSQYNVKNNGDFNNRIADGSYKLNIRTTQIVDESNGSNDDMVDSNSSMYARFKQYDLTKIIAKEIFSSLIGDTKCIDSGEAFEGTAIKLSHAICESIGTIIQVVLVLYISLTGLGFLIGTIQMNQKELISRFFKFTFVLMTLTSWDWFVQNYVRLFVVGSLQLAKMFNNSIYKILYNKEIVNSDIFDIFSSYKFVMYLLEGHLIHRLIALIFSSLAGLVIAIIICCGLVVACKVILEGIFVYISAVLTQVLLLLVAPFFMMCNLFEVTKDMFDDWVKNVFLFSIIPSTVVIVVGLFFLLLQIGLDATMGFTYCSCCWFSLMGICFIENFATLGLMFIPATGSSDFILPTGLVSGAMTFIFIVQIGYIAVNSAVEIISRMITFKAQNVGQGSMTGLGANVFASAKSLKEGSQSTKSDTESRIKDQKQLKDIGKRLDNIN